MVEEVIEKQPEQTEKVAIAQEPPAIVGQTDEAMQAPTVEMPVPEHEIPVEPKKKKKPKVIKNTVHAYMVLTENALDLFREIIITTQANFGEEISFEIDEENISFRMTDPSRVSMIDFVYPKSVFQEYYCTDDANIKHPFKKMPARFAINASDLIYILKRVKSNKQRDDKVTIDITIEYETIKRPTKQEVEHLTPNTCPMCHVSTSSYNNRTDYKKREKHPTLYQCGTCGWKGKVKLKKKQEWVFDKEINTAKSQFKVQVNALGAQRNYKLMFIEASEEHMPIPQIRFNVHAKLDAELFAEEINDITEKTGHVKMTATHESLIVEGQNDTMPERKTTIPKGSDMLIDIECKDPPQIANFSLLYPQKFIPKKTVATLITLDFSTDMPLQIAWQPNHGEAIIKFFLAPRIETD
jgi:DNA polymerase III sliding clamp (beta) subunit (PCNA family)